ncbi:TetR family transcriptional regulator [Microbacterium allomyrinae]|uniref:TetR family transcriptional regulator n=1 Tax=Microbacterium allomyrinae TaxID=2830666 RepID=A0A9X1LUE8_9MICO|nr:TetR family transcriptional regulator [Microbacterium allomyrinae]MCC2031853.1 TetR family transcriptional regulator [Microbacterium allomyrinae]
MTRASRTHAALLRAALELFEERGYDATTAAAIAARAGVTEMTFFRHFASKDAVLVDDPYDPLIAEAVARQPVELAPLAAVIAGVREAWDAVPAPAVVEVRDRLRVVSRTPSLQGALARNSTGTAEAISSALRSRATPAAEARVAAAATIGALNAALLEWADGDDPDLGSAIEMALCVLTGGGP